LNQPFATQRKFLLIVPANQRPKIRVLD